MVHIAFITNICPHYRVKTFEKLTEYFPNLNFYFFSAGNEWYWQQQHGVKKGNFSFQYLYGFSLGKTRIVPSLAWKLLKGDYDVYIKCINGRFALPITYLVARIRKKPFILWTGIWMRLNTPAHRVFFPITRYIYKHADAIVTYGEHVKRYLISEGVQPNKIFATTHAVDNEFYSQSVSVQDKKNLKIKLNIAEDKKIILYLGRIEKIKGLPYLLESFISLNRDDTILVIAGTGSELSVLKKIVSDNGIQDKVRFAGYVSSVDTLPYYAISDMFVLPSITTNRGKETWGLVVNEAFNQGLPVIATDAVGAAAGGLIENGVNGFIVPEQNSKALANAIQYILNDQTLQKQMSQNALRKIAKWDNELMVKGFEEAVEYVIRAK